MTPALIRSLKESFFVEASAGTGKTRELVHRIVAVLEAGVPVDAIVAVTFTDSAAGQMKLRVRERLDEARRNAPDPATQLRLSTALQHLDRAFIGTIHAFCALMLRARPVEACIDPAFVELDQSQAEELFAGVFRSWFLQKLQTPNPVLSRALTRLAARQGSDPLHELQCSAWSLIEWRDHPTPWDRREYDRRRDLARTISAVRAFLKLRAQSENRSDKLFESLQPVEDFLQRTEKASEIGRFHPDQVEAELCQLQRAVYLKKGYGPYGGKVSRESLLMEWEQLCVAIEAFKQRAGADLAASLREELWPTEQLYKDAKQSRGQLDFQDLLIYARNLLRDNSDAQAYFRRRFQRLFVDEFQDTDPLQSEIVQLLSFTNGAPAPGEVFLVGDPKQSIYRFRRADVDLYRGVGDKFGADRYQLHQSRRSTKPIQDFVNAAFADMPGYLPLEGGAEQPPTQPAVVALPMPEPYSAYVNQITNKAINGCAPGAVAGFIHWLLNESNWTVREHPAHEKRRPVRADDVCILFRRFTNFGVDLTSAYVRSLEARGIRHVLVGSKFFHQREEIGVIRTALRAIEWPDDELSVYGVLRGGLFAIPDGTLLRFKHTHGPLFPPKPLPDDLDPDFTGIREAFQVLTELHRKRNYRPIVDTINLLLGRVRAHAGFAFRKNGERVLANVHRLADVARAFDTTRATSFRSFVEYLESEFSSSEAAEATILEQSVEGVKLMTVHRAKGLEFPVVILADLTCNLASPEGPSRYVDSKAGLCAQKLVGCAPWELLDHMDAEIAADSEEAWRVAYVAATRACDLLVVTAVGDELQERSWLAPLYPAIYPNKANFRKGSPAPGCPPFGSRSVLRRHESAGDEEVSVRPGLHTPQRGSHDVVWFDPAIWGQEGESAEGVAHEVVLKGTAAQRSEGLRLHSEWKARRDLQRKQATAPAYSVLPATEAEAAADTDPVPVAVASSAQPFQAREPCLREAGACPATAKRQWR